MEKYWVHFPTSQVWYKEIQGMNYYISFDVEKEENLGPIQ
jgi:hypothetical protein